MNLTAAGKWILLKEVPQEQKATIFLPAGVASGKEMSSEVKVMAVESIGWDIPDYDINGPAVAKGMNVMVASYAGTSFGYEGNEYKFIEKHDILAVLE